MALINILAHLMSVIKGVEKSTAVRRVRYPRVAGKDRPDNTDETRRIPPFRLGRLMTRSKDLEGAYLAISVR